MHLPPLALLLASVGSSLGVWTDLEDTPIQFSQVPHAVEMGTDTGHHPQTHTPSVLKEEDHSLSPARRDPVGHSVKLQAWGLRHELSRFKGNQGAGNTSGILQWWGPKCLLPGTKKYKIAFLCAYSNWPRASFYPLQKEINHVCLIDTVEECPGTMPNTQ